MSQESKAAGGLAARQPLTAANLTFSVAGGPALITGSRPGCAHAQSYWLPVAVGGAGKLYGCCVMPQWELYGDCADFHKFNPLSMRNSVGISADVDQVDRSVVRHSLVIMFIILPIKQHITITTFLKAYYSSRPLKVLKTNSNFIYIHLYSPKW